ncbi:MAG: ABC transporter ATP-binding protein [Actinomycetota bacterium]|nr:ABC transporter ATP-binding protein [Actinomycetota bacterium]
MPSPAVGLEKVSLVFAAEDESSVLALDTVSLEIGAGEFVAIVGPSGCGKTTILNLLSGLIPPTAGTVERNGRKVDGPSRDIGYMLARAALSPWRNARRNVELGLEIHGVNRQERRRRAEELLSLLHLDGFANAYPSQLSQGMRQRVAIARTLAIEPGLWLLDEPFGALDAQTRMAVQSEFVGLWEQSAGSTVILVTHDLEEAVLLADRVIVLTARPGRIKSDTVVDLPRPRVIDELRFDDRFKELEHQIWRELRDEII